MGEKDDEPKRDALDYFGIAGLTTGAAGMGLCLAA
jgi:hypothetical protein